jgi:hypothetical protein
VYQPLDPELLAGFLAEFPAGLLVQKRTWVPAFPAQSSGRLACAFERQDLLQPGNGEPAAGLGSGSADSTGSAVFSQIEAILQMAG